MLVEAELIASGSVKGFVNGTHFNRCKRIHTLLATALQILHFKSFLSQNTDDNIISDEIIDQLHDIQKTIKNREKFSPQLEYLLEQYNKYCGETLNGKYGKTAQFWYTYIHLIQNFLDFSRSIRTSDFEAYRSILFKMSAIFFVFNQPNYSRWTIKFHDNLLKFENKYPNFKTEFMNGCFL